MSPPPPVSKALPPGSKALPKPVVPPKVAAAGSKAADPEAKARSPNSDGGSPGGSGGGSPDIVKRAQGISQKASKLVNSALAKMDSSHFSGAITMLAREHALLALARCFRCFCSPLTAHQS
jgi:hypothetical protein